MKNRFMIFLVIACAFSLVACGSGDSSTPPVTSITWTWLAGDNTINRPGIYGSKGTPTATTKPGGRTGAVSWIDAVGNLWLFGGTGRDVTGTNGDLNDLWRWDGLNWTWISGDTSSSQRGVYGVKRVPAATNKPGARSGAVSWIDGSGNLLLFGGTGLDGNGDSGSLNDLWSWNGINWTWISGDATNSRNGVYGTKGVATPTNKPGSRSGAVSWIDGAGILWLFGGTGLDENGNSGSLNDLWRWDGLNWTWISGDSINSRRGVYGAKGVPAPANKPGARSGAVSWIDGTGRLWLFGGAGIDGNGNSGSLNDLWRWDGLNWTWVSGDSTMNQSGIYGAKGTPSAITKPGARSGAISWIDGTGNLLLFGGAGLDGSGGNGSLNDLWRWNGANWTWVSGDSIANQAGIYGAKGTGSVGTKPGARFGAVSWIDASHRLLLFGGTGLDTAGSGGALNDLWRFP